MKSIENFTVLNTWAPLVDFLNAHWFIVTATTRTMKAQDTKRALKPNFPNFPAIRSKAKFFELRQIWDQNAPKQPRFRKQLAFLKTSVRDEKFLIVRKSLDFFCKQTRSSIIPTRKAEHKIFLIALKQDYIDAQYVKLPYSMRPFSIFCVLMRKRRQNVQKLNFKGASLRYSTYST